MTTNQRLRTLTIIASILRTLGAGCALLNLYITLPRDVMAPALTAALFSGLLNLLVALLKRDA